MKIAKSDSLPVMISHTIKGKMSNLYNESVLGMFQNRSFKNNCFNFLKTQYISNFSV
jgi:hypothetical protein